MTESPAAKASNKCRNFYEILGVSKTATSEQMKLQYRKLVLLCHPDKVEGKKDQFLKLQKAWRTLSTTESREKYNKKLKDEAIVAVTNSSNHLEIDIDDMGFDENEGYFTFPCRCGNLFVITEDDLDIGNEQIECSGCSLRATVLYEIAVDDGRVDQQDE